MANLPAKRNPDRAPTNPGAILHEDVPPVLNLNVEEAARRLHVSLLALRIGKLAGNEAPFWYACSKSTTCGTPKVYLPTTCGILIVLLRDAGCYESRLDLLAARSLA